MLEATVALQLAIGEHVEAVMVAALLLFNVALGVFQESRATAALDLLKQRLAPKARVRRDGKWADTPAADLVPGDIVQLSLGNIVPADLTIISGSVVLDQSMLTGELVPVEAGPGKAAYAGGLVRRGEAIAEVTATGPRTYFGHTAELVQTAHVESSEQRAVLGVVRALTVVNFAIVVGMVAYAHGIGMDVPRIIPLVLTALLSAVPVALPATFTLASALGARTLALRGVLLTRLSALHEAAMIDVLCADKTGTLTENALARRRGASVDRTAATKRMFWHSPRRPARPTGRMRSTSRSVRLHARRSLSVTRFIPFDPATKMAEAVLASGDGEQRVAKGAPAAIAVVAPMTPAASDALQRFTAAGYRTIAVAAGPRDRMELIGLIAFSDPPRADSSALLAELQSLGVQSVMVTGDSPATAATIAHDIGLEGAICPQGQIPDSVGPDDYAVYAGVFPEEKFRLVRAFQRRGHVVGMCGDGANDAPALRQAQMGIAVSTATDVAKAAAGIVLTEPGLGGIVACIKEGRSGLPAHPDLHVEHSGQQMRHAHRAGRRTGHDRACRADAAAAGAVDAHRRSGDDVQGGGSGESVGLSQHMACAKPDGRRRSVEHVQAVVLPVRACGRLVHTTPERGGIAHVHLSDAGSRRPGECLCVARAWPLLAIASRSGDASRLSGRYGLSSAIWRPGEY